MILTEEERERVLSILNSDFNSIQDKKENVRGFKQLYQELWGYPYPGCFCSDSDVDIFIDQLKLGIDMDI